MRLHLCLLLSSHFFTWLPLMRELSTRAHEWLTEGEKMFIKQLLHRTAYSFNSLPQSRYARQPPRQRGPSLTLDLLILGMISNSLPFAIAAHSGLYYAALPSHAKSPPSPWGNPPQALPDLLPRQSHLCRRTL